MQYKANTIILSPKDVPWIKGRHPCVPSDPDFIENILQPK